MAQLKLGDAAAARSNLQAAVKDKQGFIGLAEANRVLAALDSAG
jgi:hypothetical protein